MQFLMFILMLSPQAAIVLVVLIAVIFGDNVWHVWVPWLCGIFVGGITHAVSLATSRRKCTTHPHNARKVSESVQKLPKRSFQHPKVS